MIKFNKPYVSGSEIKYISDVINQRQLAGNGKYTKKCQNFFEKQFNLKKCLLTTSCTDALEMAAILCDLQPGDEVIMPSYTFVSTANAFVLRGAKIRFVDSRKDHPGMDEKMVEELITPKTRAIVVVHYAGVSANMELLQSLAVEHGLYLIEDAAQAIDSYFINNSNEKLPLGSIGHFATFSFHQTKNLTSGEGGMLVINDDAFMDRAEVIWEKGTNRSAFFRGEVDKYGWVDVGSSFLPSEMTAAFLWAQLEKINHIQERRKTIWEIYFSGLKNWAERNGIRLPYLPDYATNNGHMFYLVCCNNRGRNSLIDFLKSHDIKAVFHYQSLHSSKYYKNLHDGRPLPNCDHYSDALVRLPFYYELNPENVITTLTKYSNQFE